jgi:Type VI secretion system/phage-baseplate injector OB domain
MSNALLGKFRGSVVNNKDPMQIGRVQVAVPEIDRFVPAWAMPCVPAAGVNSGMFAVPSVGSPIWVEFEQGDRNRPIWVGGFWNKAADVPEPGHSNDAHIVLQTASRCSLVISDLPGPNGGIRIRTAAGAMISVSDAGIVITNGLGAVISMTGPIVDVNSGALTVI